MSKQKEDFKLSENEVQAFVRDFDGYMTKENFGDLLIDRIKTVSTEELRELCLLFIACSDDVDGNNRTLYTDFLLKTMKLEITTETINKCMNLINKYNLDIL